MDLFEAQVVVLWCGGVVVVVFLRRVVGEGGLVFRFVFVSGFCCVWSSRAKDFSSTTTTTTTTMWAAACCTDRSDGLHSLHIRLLAQIHLHI